MTGPATPPSAPLPNRRPCYPISRGNAPIVRVPGEHVWQQQPFYNQDFRVWCSRCGWLTTRADAGLEATGPTSPPYALLSNRRLA